MTFEEPIKPNPNLNSLKKTKKLGTYGFFAKFSLEATPKENNEEYPNAPQVLLDHQQLISKLFKPIKLLERLAVGKKFNFCLFF